MGAAFVCASIIWFGESYIFKFWLGQDWKTDSVLLLYLLVSTLFLVQWQISSVVLESTNRFDKFAKAQFIAHLLFLLLTNMIIGIWELHGAAILLVLLHFSLCIYAFHELKNFFSTSSISKLLSFNSFSWKILFGK
jgi:O-antigen/teichoic acid export membrane protein